MFSLVNHDCALLGYVDHVHKELFSFISIVFSLKDWEDNIKNVYSKCLMAPSLGA